MSKCGVSEISSVGSADSAEVNVDGQGSSETIAGFVAAGKEG
jgi:hypothetical protein